MSVSGCNNARALSTHLQFMWMLPLNMTWRTACALLKRPHSSQAEDGNQPSVPSSCVIQILCWTFSEQQKHSTAQPSPAQPSTAQPARHSTAQHSLAQHSQHSTAQPSTAQPSLAQHSQPSTAQPSPASIAQHSTAQPSKQSMKQVCGATLMVVLVRMDSRF